MYHKRDIRGEGGIIMEYIKCPKCGQSNTSDFWDNNTKEELGLEDTDHFISSSAPIKDHEEVDSYYYCPVCNEEISGIDLIREHQHQD